VLIDRDLATLYGVETVAMHEVFEAMDRGDLWAKGLFYNN